MLLLCLELMAALLYRSPVAWDRGLSAGQRRTIAARDAADLEDERTSAARWWPVSDSRVQAPSECSVSGGWAGQWSFSRWKFVVIFTMEIRHFHDGNSSSEQECEDAVGTPGRTRWVGVLCSRCNYENVVYEKARDSSEPLRVKGCNSNSRDLQ